MRDTDIAVIGGGFSGRKTQRPNAGRGFLKTGIGESVLRRGFRRQELDRAIRPLCDKWSAAKAFDFRSVPIGTSPYRMAQPRRASWPGRFRGRCAARRRAASGAELPASLLLVLFLLVEAVLFLIVIVAVVVGLGHSAVRLVDLVIPQLAVGAVLRQQLGMRAALDRPAP